MTLKFTALAGNTISGKSTSASSNAARAPSRMRSIRRSTLPLRFWPMSGEMSSREMPNSSRRAPTRALTSSRPLSVRKSWKSPCFARRPLRETKTSRRAQQMNRAVLSLMNLTMPKLEQSSTTQSM